jgi:hypothetical protein
VTKRQTARITARHQAMQAVYFDDCEECDGHLTPEAARIQNRYTHLRGLIRAIVWKRMIPVFTVEAYTRSGSIFRRRLTLHGTAEMRVAPGKTNAIGTVTFDHAARVNYTVVRYIDNGKVVKRVGSNIYVLAGDAIEYTQKVSHPLTA